MKIEILASASQDLLDGHAFYERQRPGLGGYFLDSLFADIDSLLLYGGTHAVLFERYYRLLARRFPYAVYYRIDGEIVRVYAVLDCRRDPEWLAERMRR